MIWRAYLRLGRVSNLPTVWTNVLAGVVLAGGQLTLRPLAALFAVFSLLYTGGMFLNDAFDRNIDARERPGRPIPSGLVSAQRAFAIGYGMLTLGLLILLIYVLWGGQHSHWGAVPCGVVLAGAIVFYNARHKNNSWSPLVMGLCRALVYVISALAVAPGLSFPVIAGAVALLSYLIGLTYVAKQETLTEYRNVWPLLFLFAPLVYALPAVFRSATGALLYVGLLGWVAYGVSILLRKGTAEISRAVVGFIAGISLLDALLIAREGATGIAWLATLGFFATLFLQRYARGS